MSWMVNQPMEDIITGTSQRSYRSAYGPQFISAPTAKAHSSMSVPIVSSNVNQNTKQSVEAVLLKWKHARERGENLIEFDNGFSSDVEQILRSEGFQIKYFPAQTSHGKGFYRLTKPNETQQRQPIEYLRFEPNSSIAQPMNWGVPTGGSSGSYDDPSKQYAPGSQYGSRNPHGSYNNGPSGPSGYGRYNDSYNGSCNGSSGSSRSGPYGSYPPGQDSLGPVRDIQHSWTICCPCSKCQSHATPGRKATCRCCICVGARDLIVGTYRKSLPPQPSNPGGQLGFFYAEQVREYNDFNREIKK